MERKDKKSISKNLLNDNEAFFDLIKKKKLKIFKIEVDGSRLKVTTLSFKVIIWSLLNKEM